MSTPFKKGLRFGLYFYLLAIVLTVISHLIMGWDYMHAPPPGFFILMLCFFAGFIRLVWNAIEIGRGKNKARHQGELIVHVIPALVFILFFLAIRFVP